MVVVGRTVEDCLPAVEDLVEEPLPDHERGTPREPQLRKTRCGGNGRSTTTTPSSDDEGRPCIAELLTDA